MALAASLALNAGLGGVIVYQIIGNAVGQYYQTASWRSLTAERSQLRAMRTRFCKDTPRPARADLLSWEKASRPAGALDAEPFDKDGLLWLRDVGVKLDGGGRLEGVCLHLTWQTLDQPGMEALDRPGDMCPLEALCQEVAGP